MIPIKDKEGNTIINIDEGMFPLSMPTTTIYGEKEYKIFLTYAKDEHRQQTKLIKSMNMG